MFLLLPSIGVQCVKCHLLNMSPMAIEYCYYTTKINVAYQNNSFHLWQWLTNERVRQHLLFVTFWFLEKMKVYLLIPYSLKNVCVNLDLNLTQFHSFIEIWLRSPTFRLEMLSISLKFKNVCLFYCLIKLQTNLVLCSIDNA